MESKGIMLEKGVLGEGGSAFILKGFTENDWKLALKIEKCETKSAVKKIRNEYKTLK